MDDIKLSENYKKTRRKNKLLASVTLFFLAGLLLSVRLVACEEESFVGAYEFAFLDRFSSNKKRKRVAKENTVIAREMRGVVISAGYTSVTTKDFEHGCISEKVTLLLLKSGDKKTMKSLLNVRENQLNMRKNRMSWFVSAISWIAIFLILVAVVI